MLGAFRLSTDKGTSSSSRGFPRQRCAGGKALAYVLMLHLKLKIWVLYREGGIPGRLLRRGGRGTRCCSEPAFPPGPAFVLTGAARAEATDPKPAPSYLKIGKGSAPEGRAGFTVGTDGFSCRWSKAVTEQHPCREAFWEEKDQKLIPSPKKSRSLAAPRQQAS